MTDYLSHSFADRLDTVLMINKPAVTGLGEDSYYCANSARSAIISVCDGCGGLGSRIYEEYSGKTGAYISSRAVSGAIHDWFHNESSMGWNDSESFKVSLDSYIRAAYKVCNTYGTDNNRIKGAMVKKFPTTLAMAYADSDSRGIRLLVVWAGDSRVYLLDQDGLAQLTVDDSDIDDAYDNLFNDAVMTNVISAEGDYDLHCKEICLKEAAVIIAATDGCFGYISSPMEFEHVILENMNKSRTPESFRLALLSELSEYAGDDLSMSIMTFGYGDYNNLRHSLSRRLGILERDYISLMRQHTDEATARKLWQKYRSGYERYLK